MIFQIFVEENERQNYGLLLTTINDCSWTDEWSWNHLNMCLSTSYGCISSSGELRFE